MLEWVFNRYCGISVLGRYSKPDWATCFSWSCFQWGVGLADHQGSLPTCPSEGWGRDQRMARVCHCRSARTLIALGQLACQRWGTYTFQRRKLTFDFEDCNFQCRILKSVWISFWIWLLILNFEKHGSIFKECMPLYWRHERPKRMINQDCFEGHFPSHCPKMRLGDSRKWQIFLSGPVVFRTVNCCFPLWVSYCLMHTCL